MQIELLVLDNNTWNYLTDCKQMSSFKEMLPIHLKIIYMYKQDLALNNHQGLICHCT